MTNRDPADSGHMLAALGLARRGLGRVAPNPAVGCILVRPDLEGRVVGRGWTQPGGRPHAETEALRRAGPLARGATAYVTLEPCSHQGQTGPCADALIDAGIARAVVATADPDPRVSGRGIGRLQDAGIAVSVGLMGPEARHLNLGFFQSVQSNTPFFSWKTATSLDGKIATSSGHSKWITGRRARQAGHFLRARHDGILIGIGTALADDPDLTCRLAGLEPCSPLRIVLDSQLRLPLTHKLVLTARDHPTWVIATEQAAAERERALTAAGVIVHRLPGDADQRPDPPAVAGLLAKRGLTRVLVEGGAGIASSFLKHRLIDRLYWFRAPIIIGNDGLSATNALDITRIDDTTPFTHQRSYDMGPDRLDVFERDRSTT